MADGFEVADLSAIRRSAEALASTPLRCVLPGIRKLIEYADAAGLEVRRLRAVIERSVEAEAAGSGAHPVITAYLLRGVGDPVDLAANLNAAAMSRGIVEELKSHGLAIVERGAV